MRHDDLKLGVGEGDWHGGRLGLEEAAKSEGGEQALSVARHHDVSSS
jgi:hypothetical protein